MAKGQKRSNKEARKPKQTKTAAPAKTSPFATDAKSSGGAAKKK
jgi:hypothetical protein